MATVRSSFPADTVTVGVNRVSGREPTQTDARSVSDLPATTRTIGGGFELAPGMVSRPLAAAHIVAVASPEYMKRHTPPQVPADLAALNGIAMRSTRTGRVRQWVMRDVSGIEMDAPLKETLVVNDPAAMRAAAVLGLGVTLIAVPDVLRELESGELIRLLPRWYADAGAISLYYASRTLLPAKTRVFIDYVIEEFKRARLAERLAGSLG